MKSKPSISSSLVGGGFEACKLKQTGGDASSALLDGGSAVECGMTRKNRIKTEQTTDSLACRPTYRDR